MAAHRDIVVTWPKTKPFRDYLEALALAQVNGEQINYRVSSLPQLEDWERLGRCYRVYDGAVRGFTKILSVCRRSGDEVKRVNGPGYWSSGLYVVCSPVWHEVVSMPMKGFQGWRYYDYVEHMRTVNEH